MSGRGGEDAGPGGVVVVDKPAGWTSHDVVARTRRLAATRRVGHAGTLDPMATGVLVLGVGRATKLLTYLTRTDKEYRATVRLGESTTTDDAEGEVLPVEGALEALEGVGVAGVVGVVGAVGAAGAADVPAAALAAAVRDLTGHVQQVPSAVSAIKVDGRRAYAVVREGGAVELAARPVHVAAFDVEASRRSSGVSGVPVLDLDVRVVVSSGTYVRALARDLGAALGTGGHLTALRRTRVGPYGLEEARSLEELERSFALTPLPAAARAAFGCRELDDRETLDLRHGRRVAVSPTGPGGTPEAPVAAFAPDGTLVALVRDERGATRPVLVLAPA